MALIVIPHQYCSFDGIFTEPGGIFTPGALDLSRHPVEIPDRDTFVNVPNRLILVVRNRSLTGTLSYTFYGSQAKVIDPPYWHVTTDGQQHFVVPPNMWGIFGPFSENFDLKDQCSLTFGGTAARTDIDVAAVILPE